MTLDVREFKRYLKDAVPAHAFVGNTFTQVRFTWTAGDNSWTVCGNLGDYGSSVEAVMVHDHYMDVKVILRNTGIDSLSAILRAVGAVAVPS